MHNTLSLLDYQKIPRRLKKMLKKSLRKRLDWGTMPLQYIRLYACQPVAFGVWVEYHHARWGTNNTICITNKHLLR
jgi:hypothetical protein